MKFDGDDADELVPYTVTYSVILITEHALEVVGMGGSRGSTLMTLVLSGGPVDVSAAGATLSSGGGP